MARRFTTWQNISYRTYFSLRGEKKGRKTGEESGDLAFNKLCDIIDISFKNISI